jgi:hypothetical protein
MTAPPTSYGRAARPLRGGLVRIDPVTRTVVDAVGFQYNPDTITRTLQPRSPAAEGGDRLEATRFTGPPHETVKFDAELDAADALEKPDDAGNRATATHGLLPALAVLERLITPPVDQLVAADALMDRGQLEILPVEAPLTVLVWSPERVLPVTISSLTITEEAFDTRLRPIRAKAAVECKVLTNEDLPHGHLGVALYLAYRRAVERDAALIPSGSVRALGLGSLP